MELNIIRPEEFNKLCSQYNFNRDNYHIPRELVSNRNFNDLLQKIFRNPLNALEIYENKDVPVPNTRNIDMIIHSLYIFSKERNDNIHNIIPNIFNSFISFIRR